MESYWRHAARQAEEKMCWHAKGVTFDDLFGDVPGE